MLPKTIRIKIRSGVPVSPLEMRRKKATRGGGSSRLTSEGSKVGGVVHSDMWTDAGYTFTG